MPPRVNRRRTRQPMGLSQYHTTLAHITRRACTMGVSTNTPRHPLTQVTLQATPSRRGTGPPSQVEESTPCVCISMSLSNPNHTTQVCLSNTPVFQTILTRKHTIVITGSSELIGRRPAYQSGRPGLY